MKVLLMPPLKPGEYPGSREMKFSAIQGNAHKYRKSPLPAAMQQSCLKDAFAAVRADDFRKTLSQRLSAHPTRSSPSSVGPQNVSHLPSLRSLQATIYVKPFDEITRLQEATDRLQLERGTTIDVRDIEPAYRNVLGAQTPTWLVLQLCKMLESKLGPRVTLEEVHETVEEMSKNHDRNSQSSRENTAARGHEAPLVGKLHARLPSSCYQETFCQLIPTTRSELAKGTTKQTCHIPGYSGFIPKCPTGEKCRQQSEAKQTRNYAVRHPAILKHNLPGYSGFQPKLGGNAYGEMKCGCNPMTTSGAAAAGLLL